jgi:hypothetical protein
MRTRWLAVAVAISGLGLLAPVASAKVYFPMRDHVMVVGKGVRLAVPGCDGCIASYPGPVRLGRLLLTPRVAGRFRLVALFTTELRTMLMPVSPVFVVHPRGWQSAA